MGSHSLRFGHWHALSDSLFRIARPVCVFLPPLTFLLCDTDALLVSRDLCRRLGLQSPPMMLILSSRAVELDKGFLFSLSLFLLLSFSTQCHPFITSTSVTPGLKFFFSVMCAKVDEISSLTPKCAHFAGYEQRPIDPTLIFCSRKRFPRSALMASVFPVFRPQRGHVAPVQSQVGRPLTPFLLFGNR